MRGIIIRQGNILVGDSTYLAKFFSEKRFATWCIGEIHISNQVKANARRDGFEHDDDMEAITEQLGLLTAHLTKVFRDTSIARSRGKWENKVSEKITTYEGPIVALDVKHKHELEKIINTSNIHSSEDITERIALFKEIYDQKKQLGAIDPEKIIDAIISVFNDQKFTILQSSEFVTQLTKLIFGSFG